jgi:hypothetical protein
LTLLYHASVLIAIFFVPVRPSLLESLLFLLPFSFQVYLSQRFGLLPGSGVSLVGWRRITFVFPEFFGCECH